jgi:tRNA (adenine22-N1)-methyltransferase
MKISPRLKSTADLIKKGSYPADIGTDHAYIPIYLIKTGICDKAIAADIKKGPLLRAERNIKIYGMQDRISIRRGSGLSPIEIGEVDCAILAGMGGYLICNILDKDKRKAKSIEYFVFQPMQAPEVLRKYLYHNNYRIIDEKLAKEDDKIYQVITAEHGTEYVEDDIYFEIGKNLINSRDPLVNEFLYKKILSLKKVMLKIDMENSQNAKLRFEECEYKLKRYEEILKWLQK